MRKHIFGPDAEAYEDIPEIVPGVFVDPGEAVYIVDSDGEVMSWNKDEWAEDPQAITATINAVIIATHLSPRALRKSIENHGKTLQTLIDTTYEISH